MGTSTATGTAQGPDSRPRVLVHGRSEHAADVPCDARVQESHTEDLRAHVGCLDDQVLLGDLERLGRERRGEQGQVGLQVHEEVRYRLVGVDGEEERGQAGRREGGRGGKEEVRVVEDDEGGGGSVRGAERGKGSSDGGSDMAERGGGEGVQAWLGW